MSDSVIQSKEEQMETAQEACAVVDTLKIDPEVNTSDYQECRRPGDEYDDSDDSSSKDDTNGTELCRIEVEQSQSYEQPTPTLEEEVNVGHEMAKEESEFAKRVKLAVGNGILRPHTESLENLTDMKLSGSEFSQEIEGGPDVEEENQKSELSALAKTPAKASIQDINNALAANGSGTEEEQAAFMKELEIFHKDRRMDFRPPKFYGEPLNCLKLWKAVVKLGGYEQVTSCKLWRQVGESFRPPKTCTTVSWTFRGFYEKALLEFEKHKMRCGELPFADASFGDPSSIGNQVKIGGENSREDKTTAVDPKLSPMASSQEQRKRKRQKGDEHTLLKELKTLGKNLLSSSSDINNLPRLLSFIDSAYPPHIVVEALLSIQSFFIPLLPKLSSSSSSSVEDTAESVYQTWLRSKFDVFVRSLMSLAVTSQADETLREVALDTIMEFVKVGNAGKFHSYVYHKLIHTIVHSTLEINDMLLQLLASKYFQYIDVRYFTYISLVKIARNLEVADLADDKDLSLGTGKGEQLTARELSIHKMHNILSSIPTFEVSNEKSDLEMWNGLGLFTTIANDENHSEKKTKKRKHNIEMPQKDQSSIVCKKMKLKFSKAWLSFLALPLPLDVYKEVLGSLHQSVMPHLSNPLLLCDFLTRSYDIGGVVSVMALSSLFILMTKHHIEYANFYEKLYALLEPSVFVAKYRGKFFQLMDSCLKSDLVPAYAAASFCKRLSRLALSVPPSGALIIIALVHNLLRRHPSINVLVHREENDKTAQAKDASGLDTIEDNDAGSFTKDDASRKLAGVDYFNDEETDLRKTNAGRSSLWEIDTLSHHYCPAVSRFVLSLENDLTVRAKTTEVPIQDFSSGSYATIFSEEIRRRVKKVPLAFYKISPSCLFSEADFPGWTFKSEEPHVAETETA